MRTVLVLWVTACGDDTPASDETDASGGGEASSTGGASATSVDPDTSAATIGTSGAASTGADGTGVDTTGDVSSSGTDTGAPLLPAEVLDLAAWKLTLPLGDPEAPDEPWEILQPSLASFVDDPHFVVAPGGGVQFRAEVEGVTTSNSGYPRSELREMDATGLDEAAWSTSTGVHRMRVTQAITRLPEMKPHVVAGQIHDADDDVVMIRLEDETLFVEGGGEELGVLDPAYALGDPFTVEIVASGGNIEIYYDDAVAPSVTLAVDRDGCYFKAGAYVQSNLEQGDVAGAYGEVVITALQVTHR